MATAKLCFIPVPSELVAAFLIGLTDLTLSLLIVIAAWQASRRSLLFARVLWLCAGFVALIWAIHFSVAVFLVQSAVPKGLPVVPYPPLFVTAFPFAMALTLPLLLNETQEKLEINWPQALDFAQLGIVVLAAFLVFFYLPFLQIPTDAARGRYVILLHVTRDGFLALGYLYRGWRSPFSDLRGLHFRFSGFLAGYGVAQILVTHGVRAWHWPEGLAGFVADLPALFLLATAAAWQQDKSALCATPRSDGHKNLLWTQILALMMPVSVVALASRTPAPYLRIAWMTVTASFALYGARLFLMQQQQNQTLISLHAMEERFSKAFRSSPIAVNITRLSDGRLLDANDRWFELTKFTRETAIGKTTVELGIFRSVQERDKFMEILRQRRTIRGMNLDFQLPGRTLNTLISAELLEIGGETMVLVSTLDMTELKNITHQLQQSQKMELVGRLAGGVAHDFNNLLTIITGNAELALTMELNRELAEHVRQIKEAAGKAGGLTKQLLAFSRRQVLQPRNISLNAVVTSIRQLLQRTLGENITIITSFDAGVGTVYADPVQMEQVVMNLAVNARDAMPGGGILRFETHNLDLTLPYPEKGFEIPPGRYVMLIVTDTGAGIRPEDLERVFEPFFTTKEVGSGTGLGLSTVYGIVRQSGGHTWAYSEPGVGTTFKVCLPRVDSQPQIIKFDPTELEKLSGDETVLVVDDDPRVCQLTAKILGQYGYHVIAANSAEEAGRCAQERGEIDLLITDLAMPGTGGKDLAEKLKSQRPALKTLYMSGYPHLTPSTEKQLAPDEAFLPKPFAPIDLVRRARRTLNRATPI